MPPMGGPLDLGEVLGRRTAELHRALASGAVEQRLRRSRR